MLSYMPVAPTGKRSRIPSWINVCLISVQSPVLIHLFVISCDKLGIMPGAIIHSVIKKGKHPNAFVKYMG